MNPFGVGIMSTFIQVAAAIGPSLFVGVLSSSAAAAASAGASAQLAEASGFSSALMVAAVIDVAGVVLSLVYSLVSRKRHAQRRACIARGAK
jgi:DHA2 family lincomycin resistance protein-like MFS transporter